MEKGKWKKSENISDMTHELYVFFHDHKMFSRKRNKLITQILNLLVIFPLSFVARYLLRNLTASEKSARVLLFH